MQANRENIVMKEEKDVPNIEDKELKNEHGSELKLDNFIKDEEIRDKKKILLDLVEIAIRTKVENEVNGYCLCYEKTEQLLNDYSTIENLKLPNGKDILNSMFKKIKESLEQPEYKSFENGIYRLSEVYKRIERMNL